MAPREKSSDTTEHQDPVEPPMRRLSETKRAMQSTQDAILKSLQSYASGLTWTSSRRR